MSAYGDLKRTKMRDNLDRSMRIRRIRRTWYHFTEDTASKIAGFVCLLMALGVCVGVWYAFNGALGLMR